MGRDQFADRAGDPHLAAAEYHEVGGDPLEFGEHVRGKHHGDAVAACGLDHGRQEVVAGHRVEGGERLVEHEQRRQAGQRDRQRELRLLPAGQRANPLAEGDLKADEAGFRVPLVPPLVEVARDAEHRADRQVPVQGRVLGDEGDPVERAGRARGLAAEHGQGARRRPGQADGQAEQGGLAGPVRADEGDEVAAGNRQRAVVQRPLAPVALAERGGLDDVHARYRRKRGGDGDIRLNGVCG